MSKLTKQLNEDYLRMTGKAYRFSIKSFIVILYSHQIRFMCVWRKNKQHTTVFRKLLLYRYSRKYGLEISSHATIGRGLYLGHPYGITVAGGVIIGDNCNLHKGCTIGSENRGKREGSPTIGNCVSIGIINSTVIGKINIENDVIIAPNSFVNFDVPDHSIVIGNPASVHSRDNATVDYIKFRV